MDNGAVWLAAIEGELETTVRRALTRLSLSAESEPDADAALKRLGRGREAPAAIIFGLPVSEGDAICALNGFHQLTTGVPVIVTANNPSASLIAAALKSGAADFVCQPAGDEEWREAIAGALKAVAREAVPARTGATIAGAFLGRAPGMAAIAATLPQIAWSDAPVLIQGETGCGKEILARALHAESQRAKQPFFKLNCAALPSELVESELFGYERGAFTGAFQRKTGIFEASDGGTVLLDEIGDMDVRLQAKLLQVLQDQTFQRIGGKELINVDVRVLAATHRDLEKSIEDGSFREDLYYRLNVINIVVPPLRERRADLFDLTEVLLKKHAKAGEPVPSLTPGLREAMLEWHWPGNVRELENFARKLLIFRDCAFSERELRSRLLRRESEAGLLRQSAAEEIETAAQRPQSNRGSEAFHIPMMAEVNQVTRRAEAEAIISALNAAHWNRRVAAALLNVDYKCLLYRMKKLGIEQHKTLSPAGDPPAPIPASVDRDTSDWRQKAAGATTS